jgi:uncharacterized protein (TIGR02996 family)
VQHPERTAFLAAIAAAPAGDELPRLAFADWLDDHDQPFAAEYLRLSVELARLRPPVVIRAREVTTSAVVRSDPRGAGRWEVVEANDPVFYVGYDGFPVIRTGEVIDLDVGTWSVRGAVVRNVVVRPSLSAAPPLVELTVHIGRDAYPHRERLDRVAARLRELAGHDPDPRAPT